MLYKLILTDFLLPFFEMKRHDQAHTYNAQNSTRSFISSKNSGEEPDEIIEEVSLSEAIEDFQLTAKVEGQAEKTLKTYDYVFNRLSESIPEDSPVTEITTQDLKNYLASLMEDNWK